ncbi:MAG: ATP-binding cassette domain-containing protein [Rickettsiales bacterium]|jgi:phospholipid/cholesterol/gamma-HCH transport system ATP-binding protein|nr:ATP-binding cassette domain-containing protein [Rickettsiales bacterium]
MKEKNIKIKVKNLSKSFGAKKVLNGINLDVFEKESLVLLGTSGTGKSVLLKTMCGLMEPDDGDIFIDDTNIKKYNKDELMSKFGYLFQGGALFDSLKVWENITFRLQNQKIKQNKLRDIAVENLRIVGLNENCIDLYPSELSGGMQKRVSLARTICLKPDIIFFDEPTTGLDPIMSDIISNLIARISKQLDTTTITITHDITSMKKIADKVSLLYDGRVIWYGNNKELEKTNNPYLKQFVDGKEIGPIRIR